MVATGPQMQTTLTPPEQLQQKEQTPPRHTIPITGRFDKYRSSFWAAMLAVLGVRYVPKSLFRKWSQKEETAFHKKHAYAISAGAIMEGVTGFFSYRTYQDMRSIYAQTLAWEFNKKPEDVDVSDFRNSENTMVRQTFDNHVSYDRRRALINSVSFLPALASLALKLPGINKLSIAKSKTWNPDHWHGETGADWGLGALAAYLFIDVIKRKGTPFEALQTTIDLKINHSDGQAGEITGADLLNIYERHADNGKIKSFIPQRGTPQWDQSMIIFNRMADLMNQTYKNTTPNGYADFGMDDFLFMMGNNLIQPGNVPQTLAFIEIANRYDMPALKEVVSSMQNGGSLEEALRKYPVAPADSRMPDAVPTEKKFAEGVPVRSTERAVAMTIAGSVAEQVAARRLVETEQQVGQ